MSKPASRSDVQRVLDAIRNLVRALRLSEREAEREHGISSAQMFVLSEIGSVEGVSLRELAERTATDQSSVSVVVKKLEEGGLVLRSWSADDARKAELRVSPRGRKILTRMTPTAQQKLLLALRDLPAARQRALAGMLERITTVMGEDTASPPMLFHDSPTRKKKKTK